MPVKFVIITNFVVALSVGIKRVDCCKILVCFAIYPDSILYKSIVGHYINDSILHKSIAGRYRSVRVADGPITARYRFM